jgi:hypothetical protein
MKTTDQPVTGMAFAVLEAATRPTGNPPAPNRADMLDYVSDMILELKTLANQADCKMLVSLLDLAQREAAERSRMAAHFAKLSA